MQHERLRMGSERTEGHPLALAGSAGIPPGSGEVLRKFAEEMPDLFRYLRQVR
jgi:hypothetical protein